MPFFRNQTQYQSKTDPLVPIVPEDSWHQPWSEPVRWSIAPALAVALIVSSGIVTPITFSIEASATASSITYPGVIISQSHTEPVFVPPEIITFDKWNYPWSEPVRVKPRLLEGLQQVQAQVLIPPPPQQTSIAQFISADVQYETRIQYQSQARPTFVPVTETVTVDKWFKPFDDPVRHKIGLRASLQQAFIAPVLADEQITGTFESRWHQSWSEPVRFKRFPTSEQQAQIQGAIFVPEVITVDKWVYPWTDPVRLKIGLRTSLQQALIAPVLTDDQIIGTIESRWHQGWSEPVRFRQFPTSEQQALIQGPAQTPEFITVDKWIYPWTDPVRQKIGLKTHLQTALIAPVLNPETQITQDIESRWHQPWSEPVRVKRPLLTAQQQALVYQSAFFETINIDKWGFAWSEPVRQKIGLKTHLQQAFIGLTLNPETQIIQTYESRWHQAWSEPIRRKVSVASQPSSFWVFTPAAAVTEDQWHQPWSEPVRQKRGLAANLQLAHVQPVIPNPIFVSSFSSPVIYQTTFQTPSYTAAPQFIFETVTLDKWVYPLSEPVRFKRFPTAQQPSFFAPSQVIPEFVTVDKWTYPWSEPVRFRRFPTAEQPSYTAPPTSVFENITVDKWIYAWSDPVRQKIGIKANLQQAFIGLTLNPETQIIQGYQSRWYQPWSEPLRRKPGLGAWLQDVTTPKTPIFPTGVVRLNQWFAPLNEPVRLKIGLSATLQRFFQTSQEQILSDVTLILSATEVNSDSAFFGVTVYNQVAPIVTPRTNTVVSIKEIPAVRKADVSTEEIEAIDNASVSIEET